MLASDWKEKEGYKRSHGSQLAEELRRAQRLVIIVVVVIIFVVILLLLIVVVVVTSNIATIGRLFC